MSPPFLSETAQRIVGVPELPPDGFDATLETTTEAELERYGLPPRPDRLREPAMYAIWKAMLGGGMRHVRPESRRHVPKKPAPVLAHAFVAMTKRRFVAHRATSRNWSGAYLTAARGDRFRSVAASWTVPDVKPGMDEPLSGLPHRCSIWVGVDGKHRWAGSLPQLGTEHTAASAGKQRRDRIWWQWWVRGGDTLQHYVDGLVAEPGDEVAFMLTIVRPDFVRFHFANRSKLTFATEAVECDRPVLGSFAEWIVERPSDAIEEDGELRGGELHPMPDFGRVSPSSFAARAITAGEGNRAYGLRPARLIANTDVRSSPRRSAIAAWPRWTRDGGLEVRYR